MSSMEQTMQELDYLMSQYLNLDRSIWCGSHDVDAFLQATDDLVATVHELDDAAADHLLLDSAENLLERCASRLGVEFQDLIETAGFSSDDSDDVEKDDSSIPVALPVKDLDIVIDALPDGVIFEANRIASRMVAAGFGRECAESYAATRHSFIDESIARLGVHAQWAAKFRLAPWEELEPEIARWIPALRAVFRILVPSERYLSGRVFEGLAPYGDLAFCAVCHDLPLRLLSFADAVAAAGHAPECLFRMVDMYEAARDILADLDPAFLPKITAVCNSLASSIKGIFTVLENLIRRDPSQPATPHGGVHPITRYVMNYLMAACASRHTLEEVMQMEFHGVGAAAVDPDRPTSSLAVHIAWIMDVLLKNLESKSKIYRHLPLSCIFLMNNGKYIIKKVDGCELKVLLGENWINEMTARVRRWIVEYRQATWTKAVAILQTGRGLGDSVNVTREKLRHFSEFFEAICHVQSRWVVADEQLRVDLSSSVEELVLPAYRDAVARFRDMAGAGREVYVRAEDVRSRIHQLFHAMAK